MENVLNFPHLRKLFELDEEGNVINYKPGKKCIVHFKDETGKTVVVSGKNPRITENDGKLLLQMDKVHIHQNEDRFRAEIDVSVITKCLTI